MFKNTLTWPLNKLIKLTRERNHYKTTASMSRHNDIYVVEFPKSGITWLSVLLANISLLASGRTEIATFASVRWYVPSIYHTRNIGNMIYDKPPVRFIKSHAEFNPNYVVTIYLVRHPLPVMKSYYRYLIEFGKKIGSFDAFIRSHRYGIPAWKRHVNSWCTGGMLNQHIILIRYEDLIEDAARELQRVNQLYGWEIDSSLINKAVGLASVESMKNNERLLRDINPRYTINFVRGELNIKINEKQKFYIKDECREELRLLKYED